MLDPGVVEYLGRGGVGGISRLMGIVSSAVKKGTHEDLHDLDGAWSLGPGFLRLQEVWNLESGC